MMLTVLMTPINCQTISWHVKRHSLVVIMTMTMTLNRRQNFEKIKYRVFFKQNIISDGVFA